MIRTGNGRRGGFLETDPHPTAWKAVVAFVASLVLCVFGVLGLMVVHAWQMFSMRRPEGDDR